MRLAIDWRRISLLGWILLLLVIGFLVLTPVLRLEFLALADSADAYRRLLSVPTLWATIRTTVALAVCSVVIALTLGTCLAWAAYLLPPRLRWMAVGPLMPLIVPGVANVIGWTVLLSPRAGYLNVALRQLPFLSSLETGPIDIFRVEWIILITGFSLTSFVYLFCLTSLRSMNARLYEAAEVCGSGLGRNFFHVTLPLLRPALAYAGAIVLLLGLGQFIAPLLLGRRENINVLTTEMYASVQTSPVDFALAAAFGSPLVVAGLLLVLLQKFFIGNVGRFVTFGDRPYQPVKRSRRWAVASVAAYTFVAVVLPIGALTILALSPFWSARIDPSKFTLENLWFVLENPRSFRAITTSLVTSLLAVAITLPLTFGVAMALISQHRRTGKLRWLLDFIVNIPLGVPAVIFGVGVLYTYTRPPLQLYGTTAVIVLTYITLMIPHATRMQLSGLIGLGQQYAAAARVSGAGPIRTTVQIVFPLIRPSLAAAAALMFVLLSHEFAASVFVRSAQNQVMGTLMVEFWVNSTYPAAAAMGMLMILVTAAGVVAAIAIGGTRTLERI